MAASKDLTKSIAKGSEEMLDVCCSPCNDDGRTTEAKKFCVECDIHFCENCLRVHKKIPSLQSHQIVDSQGGQSQSKDERMELPTERCSSHHGKLMDMFCGDHDEVCCGACIAVKHRACINVDYVPDVAKGIRTSKEHTDVTSSITELLDQMKKERNTRDVNLKRLEQEKNKALQDVDKYQEDIILKIKELAESSRKDIKSKYEKVKKVITADVDTLDTLIAATNINLKKLSIANEAQLFVHVKISKTAVKDGGSVLSEMSSSWTNKKLNYSFDGNLKKRISSMVSFGNLEEEEDFKEYKATSYGKFTIKDNTDTSIYITGICFLQNDSIALADYQNKKLKLLKSKYTVYDSISLVGTPIGMCNVGKNEVAVCFDNVGKIQFVSVANDLKLTYTMAVDKTCYGIAYNDSRDELLACCGSSVNVYNMAGSVIRAYQFGTDGEQLFSATRQVTINTVNNQIVVADKSKGLVAVNTQGTHAWSFSDQELIAAWGLCSLPNGNILVSGNGSNNVLQVDKSGRKLGVLIGVSEGLIGLFSLAFDRHSSRLIVGCSSNEIHVYTLSRQ